MPRPTPTSCFSFLLTFFFYCSQPFVSPKENHYLRSLLYPAYVIATINPEFSDSENISQRPEGAPPALWRSAGPPHLPVQHSHSLPSTPTASLKNILGNGYCKSGNTSPHLCFCWKLLIFIFKWCKSFSKDKKKHLRMVLIQYSSH